VKARPRLRRLLWVAALTAAVLVVIAVVLDTDEADPCAPPEQAPAAELALMPRGLSFDRIGTVTSVSREGSYVTLLAVTAKPLEEATVLIQEAVVAAGYRANGTDSEGFEAEVFFTTGSFAAGQAALRQSGCKGRWDVSLLLLRRRG
jgi:hypothetical protein